MAFPQHPRLLEEALGRHGEKLGGIGGPVIVEHGGAPQPAIALQSFILGIEYARPCHVLAAMFQERSAIDRTVLAVQLVGKFVQDEVLSIVDIGRPGLDVIPGENDNAAGPRLALQASGFASSTIGPPIGLTALAK